MGQGTKDKRQGTKDKTQGTRDKEQRARDKGQDTRDKRQGTEGKGQGKRDKEQGTRARDNGQGQGTRDKEKEGFRSGGPNFLAFRCSETNGFYTFSGSYVQKLIGFLNIRSVKCRKTYWFLNIGKLKS